MFNTQEKLQEIKIIVLGNSGVGKTSIINNYIFNKFNPDIETTFANSLSSKVIKKGKIKYKLNIWDTIGQEKYHSITNLFIKGANAVILVYSIDSLSSFEGLNFWYKSTREHLQDNNYSLFIVGSKSDLFEEEVVSEEEARNFAEKREALFKLVSSKEDSDGINSLFETILEETIERKIIKPNDSITIKNEKEIKKQIKKEKKCC